MNPRLGRCYELSYQFATSNSGYELVHGYIINQDGSRVIDHAWTEKDDTVYDPVMDQELPKPVYYAMLNAEETKRYSGMAAMKKGLETGVYGPWHEIPKGVRRHPDLKESSRIRESLSKVVYHMTYVDNAIRILSTDEFRLTSSLGTQSDALFEKYHYYMSFSSVKFGGYARVKEGPGLAILVLDGDALNERYRGAPVDYWGREGRPNDLSSDEAKDRFLKHDENEERLFSNVPTIKAASKYVKEIHVYLGSTDDEYAETWSKARELTNWSKAIGIPSYYYSDKQAFRAQAKSKAKYSAVKSATYVDAIIALCERDLADIPNEFPYDRAKDAIYGGFRAKDFLAALEADVHNMRTDDPFRGQISRLSKLIMKTKSKDVKGLLAYASARHLRGQKAL